MYFLSIYCAFACQSSWDFQTFSVSSQFALITSISRTPSSHAIHLMRGHRCPHRWILDGPSGGVTWILHVSSYSLSTCLLQRPKPVSSILFFPMLRFHSERSELCHIKIPCCDSPKVCGCPGCPADKRRDVSELTWYELKERWMHEADAGKYLYSCREHC